MHKPSVWLFFADAVGHYMLPCRAPFEVPFTWEVLPLGGLRLSK